MAEGKVLDFRQKAFYIELARYQALKDTTGDTKSLERFLFSSERRFREENSFALLVMVYNEQGAFYRSVERYRLSAAAYKKAQKQIEKLMGRSCEEYAALLNNMAGTYRLAGQYPEALKLFEEALRIYEEIGIGGEGADEEELYMPACVHNNLGQVLRESGKILPAICHMKIALAAIEDMPSHVQEAGLIYSNLTTLYRQVGNLEEASKCLDRALAIFEIVPVEKDRQYTKAMGSLAGFLCGIGDYERAVRVYKKAAEDTAVFYRNTEEYAVLYQSLYWVYRKTGDDVSAMKALNEAVDVLVNVFGENSERVKTVKEELSRIQKGKSSPAC